MDAETQALADRVAELESQVEFLLNFGVVDPAMSAQLIGFFLGLFILSHAVGRAARAMGKF